MRNASGQQDEKSAAVKKKKEQEHKQQNFLWGNTTFSPVSCFGHAKQWQRIMYKKCAGHAKFVFFAIVCLFVCFFFAVLIAIAV